MDKQGEMIIQHNDMVKLFNKETDRAAAVLTGSYLEDLLAKYLKSKMDNVSNSIENEIFSGHGPLSTFSSRITLARAFGFIDERVYRNLNLIRKIRNEFAHRITSASFEDEDIKNRSNELNLMTFQNNENSRSKFLLTAGYITIFISEKMTGKELVGELTRKP